MALAMIARLFGPERAESVAVLTEYERQTDGAQDPFHAYLNQTQWVGKALGVPTG